MAKLESIKEALLTLPYPGLYLKDYGAGKGFCVWSDKWKHWSPSKRQREIWKHLLDVYPDCEGMIVYIDASSSIVGKPDVEHRPGMPPEPEVSESAVDVYVMHYSTKEGRQMPELFKFGPDAKERLEEAALELGAVDMVAYRLNPECIVLQKGVEWIK